MGHGPVICKSAIISDVTAGLVRDCDPEVLKLSNKASANRVYSHGHGTAVYLPNQITALTPYVFLYLGKNCLSWWVPVKFSLMTGT